VGQNVRIANLGDRSHCVHSVDVYTPVFLEAALCAGTFGRRDTWAPPPFRQRAFGR